MRWFRSHLRLGSQLALFALVVQLVLSFAHVHGPGSSSDSPSIITLIGAPQAPAVDVDAPSKNNKSHGLAGDICAICSVLQMVASSALASAPSVPLPIVTGRSWRATDIARELATSPRLSFRARAPPQA